MKNKVNRQTNANYQEKNHLFARQSIDKKVQHLLSQMTLEEKIAQLGSIWIYELLEGNSFSQEKAKKLMKHGIGQITRLGGASNFSPVESARIANKIQKFLLKDTRLGVPAIIHEESCCGYMAKGATCFPQAIGAASTWQPELVKEMAVIIREQMKSVGAHQALAPVLDITRDARWGRVEETFGEDPYLVSIMGLHYIAGIQGNDWKEGIMATAKHFVGYGLSEGGMNWAPAHIPQREMQEVFLLPFEVAVKEAKVAAIMPAYHELDGIPCHSSTELLRDILRQQWGFDGLVVSDYFAINMLKETHLIVSNKENAARLAIEAGVDIELPSTDCYGKPLKDLLQKGKINEQLINESVARILKKKFLLGIFDNPSVDENKSSKVFDTPKQRNFAHRIARESIVLLKNENNILPLKKDFSSIAVIGPNAHNARNIIGDYAYPCHIESLLDMKKDDKFNTPIPSKVEMDNNFVPILTVLEGIKEKVSQDTKIFYTKGCAVLDDSRAGFSEALEYVRKAEVAIVVMGDKSGLIDDCTSGETRDRASLNLPGVQEELIKEIHKTGIPIVLVLINGRPLSINWAARRIPAIIEAWLPGEEGARAIADVIFGDYNPGGKLPISFPRSVGQVPVYYNHKPSGGRSHWKGDYVEMSSKPLFPFGHGLSYTNFEYSNIVITPRTISRDSQVKTSVDIKNIGSSTGDEVIQLYVHNRQSTITRPLKELKGFKRITLQPGEKKTVYFILLSEQLGFYNKEFKYVVEPATVKVMIGSSSEDIRLVDEYEIIE